MTYQTYNNLITSTEKFFVYQGNLSNTEVSSGLYYPNYQVWNKPKDCKLVSFIVLGAGGGGAGGNCAVTGVAASGGGGGAAGYFHKLIIPAFFLPDKLYISVGNGGLGGSGGSFNNLGQPGFPGGNSIISFFPVSPVSSYDETGEYGFNKFIFMVGLGGNGGIPGGTPGGGAKPRGYPYYPHSMSDYGRRHRVNIGSFIGVPSDPMTQTTNVNGFYPLSLDFTQSDLFHNILQRGSSQGYKTGNVGSITGTSRLTYIYPCGGVGGAGVNTAGVGQTGQGFSITANPFPTTGLMLGVTGQRGRDSLNSHLNFNSLKNNGINYHSHKVPSLYNILFPGTGGPGGNVNVNGYDGGNSAFGSGGSGGGGAQGSAAIGGWGGNGGPGLIIINCI